MRGLSDRWRMHVNRAGTQLKLAGNAEEGMSYYLEVKPPLPCLHLHRCALENCAQPVRWITLGQLDARPVVLIGLSLGL